MKRRERLAAGATSLAAPTVISAQSSAWLSRGPIRLLGHGHCNAERQGGFDAAAERALLRHCREQMQQHNGRTPAGWLSPWISESLHPPTCSRKPATPAP